VPVRAHVERCYFIARSELSRRRHPL